VTIKRIIFLCLLCSFLQMLAGGLPPALAVSMDKSPRVKECAVMIGNEAIQVSGYEPDVSEEKYCEEFPSAGRIIFAFDLGSPAMRELPVEIRIIKDQALAPSADAGLASVTEAYLPPRIYKSGTINLDHDFKESGQFIALLTLIEPTGEKKTAQFKFSVGRTFFYFVPLIMAALLIGGALFFYWRNSVRRPV
jgi:hypothetical protein